MYRPFPLIAAICFALFTLNAAALGPSAFQVPQGNSVWSSTHLIEVKQGSRLSQAARSLGEGGYELSDATPVRLRDWYRTNWTDLHVSWMTQVNENVGLIFGASTGERGRKYTIQPGVKLGLLMQAQPARDTVVMLRATTVLGGRLREKSCVADYGEIGGVQEVNCRLAATPLPPADTLKYLVNKKSEQHNHVSVMLKWQF